MGSELGQRRLALLARRRRGSSRAPLRCGRPRRTCARCGRGRCPRRRRRWRSALWSGWSALVRTPIVRDLVGPLHDLGVVAGTTRESSGVDALLEQHLEHLGAAASRAAPRMTSPVKPSMVIQSPSLTVSPSTMKLRALQSMSSAPQPTTQTLPIWRATSAAWLVMPPRAVRMPWAASMPRMSSGLVSSRTSRTFSPLRRPGDGVLRR